MITKTDAMELDLATIDVRKLDLEQLDIETDMQLEANLTPEILVRNVEPIQGNTETTEPTKEKTTFNVNLGATAPQTAPQPATETPENRQKYIVWVGIALAAIVIVLIAFKLFKK
jgi:hypothetical protein